MTVAHTPVLVEELLASLEVAQGACVLDATVGLGGHAEAILERVGPGGRLIGLDRDQQALAKAQDRLRRFAGQVKLLHGHFGELAHHLEAANMGPLDAVLFDLGVSSFQLDSPERGFSFQKEGPLDMRMDPEESATAAELINHASEQDLSLWIKRYGEERWAGRIARALVNHRPIQTTTNLAQCIRGAIPGGDRPGRIDPATRTFQAIRIVLNRELELLPLGLAQATEQLKPGGRLGVLAYHSLEDKIVKETFRKEAKTGRLELLTRKPIRPSEEEVAANPRSRSARLRAAKRLDDSRGEQR